jgi:hypothetical protein
MADVAAAIPSADSLHADATNGVVARIPRLAKPLRHRGAHDGELQPAVGQRLVPVRDRRGIDVGDAERGGQLARRQLPEPAEQAGRRAPHEHDLVAVPDPHRGPREQRQLVLGLTRRDDRQLVLAPAARGLALRGERAGEARRFGRRAQRRAELHQALIEIAGRGIGGERRHQLAGARPQRALPGGGLDVVVDREHAGEHARDVAVDERRAFAERDRRDRARGVPPDAGHLAELGRPARQRTAPALRDRLRTGVQVARARVTEAGPRGEHVVERRIGERARGRKPRHQRSQYGITVCTRVCWSMISETQIAYGSRVRRHGRSRRVPAKCATTARASASTPPYTRNRLRR